MKVIHVILTDGKEIEIELEKIEALTVLDYAEETPVPVEPIPAVMEEVVPDTPAPAVMEEPIFEDVPTTSEEMVIDTTDAPIETLSVPNDEVTFIAEENPSETVSGETMTDALDDIVNLVMNDTPTTSGEIVDKVSDAEPETKSEEPKKEEPSADFVGA